MNTLNTVLLPFLLLLLPSCAYAVVDTDATSLVSVNAMPVDPEPEFEEYRVEWFDEKVNLTQDPVSGEIVLRMCNIFIGPRAPNDAEFRIDIWSVSYAVDTASISVDIDFKACLEIYMDPCSESVGIRFAMDEDLRVIPVVDLGLGFSTKDLFAMTFKLKDSVLHSWRLPPILDGFTGFKSMFDDEFCANITIKYLPRIQLCFAIDDFKVGYGGISMCPSVIVRFGTKNLLKIDYHSLTGGDCPGALPATGTCQCPIGVGIIPTCNVNGTTHNVTTIESFKSFDFDSDHLINITEWRMGVARFLGNDAASLDDKFHAMDLNGDGNVHFTEYSAYTERQTATFVATQSEPNYAAVVVLSLFGVAGVVGGIVLYKKPATRRRLKTRIQGLFSSSAARFNRRRDAYRGMETVESRPAMPGHLNRV